MCSSFSQSLLCPISYLVIRAFCRALYVSFLIFFLHLWWMVFVFKIYICDYLVLTALLSRISSILCANMDEPSMEGIWSDAPFSLPLQHQLLKLWRGDVASQAAVGPSHFYSCLCSMLEDLTSICEMLCYTGHGRTDWARW